MKSNELDLRIQRLRAKAQAILDMKDQVTEQPKTWAEKVINFLNVVFSCADPDEIWLKYPHNPNYKVSSYGRVMNTRGTELKAHPDGCTGYLQVTLHSNGTKKNKKVHQLVAETFIYRPEGTTQVNHIDEDKTNNTLENLEWLSARENKAYSRKKDAYTPYTGVTWCKKKMMYKAQIFIKGKCVYLGQYKTAEEASAAYKAYLFDNKIANKYAK